MISFSQDATHKIGVILRSFQQDVQIVESIPEDVRDTPLADSKADLVAMARLPWRTGSRCHVTL